MKRVLIVYHSFDGTEMGPIRIRRVARHLLRHDFQPVVLTTPATARSTVELPEGVELLRAKAPDLAAIYRKLRPRNAPPPGTTRGVNQNIGFTSAVNRWLMVPDKQIVWRRAALRTAREYLRASPVDLIFASLAPRTNLLVANRLASEFRLPCVMEYRDLWTGSPYYHLDQATWLHRKLHERMERNAIRGATRVSAVCRGIARHLQDRYSRELRAPVALNYNFFDPDEYKAESSPERTEGPMRIAYIGAMYTGRNPSAFFEGLRSFIDRHAVRPDQLRFRWAGPVLGLPALDAMLERLALRPYIDFLGQRTHAEALSLLQESDLSLLIQAPGDNIHIPGKLFEAMGARIPVLAVSEPCEVTEIIARVRAGWTCAHDADTVANTLAVCRRHVESRQRWPFDEAERDRFSADAAVGGLASLFREVLAS
ncbi:MAG TPA: glycosyltransferase [Kiritimatiellia bacterium]|nr:glycosyltransferase [Kiritimatiellia bacterium]